MRFTFLLILFFSSLSQSETPTFRLHLAGEPRSLNPSKLRGSEASYLYTNIFKGLLKYDDQKGLVPEGAEFCTWQASTRLKCKLNPKVLWSDGTPVKSIDYVKAFQKFVHPQSKSLRFELLEKVKNAKAIFSGKKKTEELGVHASSDFELEIHLEKADSNFTYNLANLLLTPLHKKNTGKSYNQWVFNGPYTINKWERGKRIKLTPNPHYIKSKGSHRPNVEILFIKNDSTALSLYEKGTLTFLRRLPFSLINKYKNRKDFFLRPLTRFDYLGFGPEIDDSNLRKALSLSLDYAELQKIMNALGRPGCPALPLSYTDKEACHDFDLKKAQKALNKVSDKSRNKRYEFVLSQFGGSDHREVAQWFQSQWRKNLGLNINIRQIEQKYFLHKLRNQPPAIFRKGVGLLNPHCLSALKTFQAQNNQNYIRFNDSKYEQILNKIQKTQSSKEKKRLCRQGIERLLETYSLIPMGRMHFAFLAQPVFQGWRINELNQLDLTDLKYSPYEKPDKTD